MFTNNHPYEEEFKKMLVTFCVIWRNLYFRGDNFASPGLLRDTILKAEKNEIKKKPFPDKNYVLVPYILSLKCN